ncbi:membrane protein [Actinorhabdospora filicis]|uniref:Membrane protein n=1 Tax=Actinorhabdospora filicis TaxID=1785913 RepID=A0A9W6W822_9ACTN|nr:hypothetical protein [Actinorhabdospora filicis]GLZ76041.1 membrane protein [Actinorhabdospora filicis]
MSESNFAGRGTGVIHDIGYRHYDGRRGGRPQIRRALYVQSLRGVFGLGRAARTKILPFTLASFMVLPAVILVAVQMVMGSTTPVLPFASYAIVVQAIPALFLAALAPQTVSRDLRFHTMPLYFSRPLTYKDYVAAKFAGMTSALFILFAVPIVVLYAGALLAKAPFLSNTGDFLMALVAAVFLSALLSVIGLLIASLTPRRGLGVAAIITLMAGSFTVVSAVQGITTGLDQQGVAAWAGLFSPMTLFAGAQDLLPGVRYEGVAEPSTAGQVVFAIVLLALIAGGYALLSLRYKKVSS